MTAFFVVPSVLAIVLLRVPAISILRSSASWSHQNFEGLLLLPRPGG